MLIATVTEAKNRLSALIDRVKGGDSVLIVDRGIPVARLESVIGAGPDPEGRVARLERSGALRAARAEPATSIVSSAPPRLSPGASGVSAVLDERRGGR